MEENGDPKPVISWPLDPVTQQCLRRWLEDEQDSDIRYITWRVLENSISHSLSTGFGGEFRFPFTGTLTNVYAYVDTAGTTGSATVDLNINGSTILSTKITIDSTEEGSWDAATPPVLSTTRVTKWDVLTVDIDVVQTTPAKGLTVVIVIQT